MTQRYDQELDIILMRQIVKEAINPKEKGKSTTEKWGRIVEQINAHLKEKGKKEGIDDEAIKLVNLRQTKERGLEHLEVYKAKKRVSQKASGVEEEYSEMDQLLEDWMQLIEEFKGDKKAADKKKVAQGFVLRKAAMESLKKTDEEDDEDSASSDEDENNNVKQSTDEDDEEEMPVLEEAHKAKRSGKKRKKAKKVLSKKRTKLEAIFGYLNDQNNIKMKDMELQQRKIELEERKMKIEEERHANMMRMLMDKKNGNE